MKDDRPEALRLPDPQTLRLAVDAVRVLSMDAVQAARSGHPGAPMGLGYPPVTSSGAITSGTTRRTPGGRTGTASSSRRATPRCSSTLSCTSPATTSRSPKSGISASGRAGHPDTRNTGTPRGGDHHGPARPGRRELGRNRARRTLARRTLQPAGPQGDRPPHLRDLLGRGPDGGDLPRGGRTRGSPAARQARLDLRRQPGDDRGGYEPRHLDRSAHTLRELRLACGAGGGRQRQSRSSTPRSGAPGRRRNGLPSSRSGPRSGGEARTRPGSADAHGAPLGPEEVEATKEALGYPSREAFLGGGGGRGEWEVARTRGRAAEAGWRRAFERYSKAHPELARELTNNLSGPLPDGWRDAIAGFEPLGKPEATRNSSGRVLQRLAGAIPNLVGGSADLAPSNKTMIAGSPSILPGAPGGRTCTSGCGSMRWGPSSTNGTPRRPRGLRWDLPRIRRLHAPRDPPRRADGPPRPLRLHARLDRPRRGTGRPTSPSSTSWRCARSRTSST